MEGPLLSYTAYVQIFSPQKALQASIISVYKRTTYISYTDIYSINQSINLFYIITRTYTLNKYNEHKQFSKIYSKIIYEVHSYQYSQS